MKNVTFICCFIVCSFFGLVACSKHTDPVQPTPPPVDTTTTPGGDTTPSPYQPGDTLTLIGSANDTSYPTALLYAGDKGISMPEFPAFKALGKAFVGTGFRTRSIMKFRLKRVYDSLSPNQPPIQKALLYLYQYTDTASKDPYTVQQDANNGAEIHRVVGYWQDNTITWHTQPKLADSSANPLEDMVTIPPVTTPLAAGTTDNQVIDITDMVRVMFAAHDNKGFLLKLTNEAGVTGRSFGSFACPDASKRPKLVIFF